MDNEAVLELSAELADEIERNTIIDPRTVPARFSTLKHFARSPLHYFEACQTPQDETIISKLASLSISNGKGDALRFGVLIHELLLGDADRIASWDGGRRAGKTWDAWVSGLQGRGFSTYANGRAELERARAIADSIRRHELACSLLFDGTTIEERIDWTFNGKAMRSTPDAYRVEKRGRSHCADLKTAVTATPGEFDRHAFRLFYHVQQWIYAEAIEAKTGRRPAQSFLVVVEKTRPFPTTVFRIGDRALEVAERIAVGWIEMLNACEAANAWPAYAAGPVDLEIEDHGLGLTFHGEAVAP